MNIRNGRIVIEKRERWKRVKETLYNDNMCKLKLKYKLYVSNYGRIRKEYDSGKEEFTTGSMFNDGAGYKKYVIGLTTTKQDGTRKSIQVPVHRLVAWSFLGEPENIKMIPNHLDGNSLNNRDDNLEWTTSGKNQIHAYENGLKRIFRGVDHQGVKLTESHIQDTIIPMLLDNYSDAEIAHELKYITTIQNINRIRRKKTWIHLTDQYDFPSTEDRLKKPKAAKNSKIKESDMDEIIIPMLMAGKGDTEISKSITDKKVSRKAINKIRLKKTWGYYTKQYEFPQNSWIK